MPTLNKALLGETMRYILEHPDEHDQGVWVNECGTAACFAGHAVNLTNDYTFDPPMASVFGTDDTTLNNGVLGMGAVMFGDIVVTATSSITGESETISEAAERELGLTHDQASVLFHSGNTVVDLQTMVTALLSGGELPNVDDWP